ncbi:unnamed protein product [Nyctereutes procyonoides]|uniref:(raccoon dog) hypothetical protein n=1 Tax=Nyctereutes procyonoides TaxID=34880 RepID=A0A811YGV6_NYCPR|nr:unnamed protein product [Nyctereutes procyonoides]
MLHMGVQRVPTTTLENSSAFSYKGQPHSNQVVGDFPRGSQDAAAKETGEWILDSKSQQNSTGTRRGAGEAEASPPGAERGASADLALPFPYTFLNSWTKEFNLACLPLPTDLRIQPEPVSGVLISITSSPKAPTAVFPPLKGSDQIKQRGELHVQKSSAWDSESKAHGRKGVSSKIFQNPDSREVAHNLKIAQVLAAHRPAIQKWMLKRRHQMKGAHAQGAPATLHAPLGSAVPALVALLPVVLPDTHHSPHFLRGLLDNKGAKVVVSRVHVATGCHSSYIKMAFLVCGGKHRSPREEFAQILLQAPLPVSPHLPKNSGAYLQLSWRNQEDSPRPEMDSSSRQEEGLSLLPTTHPLTCELLPPH